MANTNNIHLNYPMFDGLYHPKRVIFGMVYGIVLTTLYHY